MIEFGEGQAAFDSRAEYCKELSHMRRACIFARQEGNIEKWHGHLESYYLTLYPRMHSKPKKDEQSMREVQIEYCNKARVAIKEYTHAKMIGKNTMSMDIYKLFFNWEMQLRDDEDKLGLLMPSRDDPAYALGGKSY